MKLDKLEIFVHDYILKNVAIRRLLYGLYQRANVLLFPQKPKDDNIRRISPDDGFEYFFGYYDKCPWSEDGRNILSLQVKNATESPDSSEVANIVILQIGDPGKVEVVAQTRSWNVQQGCMLQWFSRDEILFNDYREGRYCAVLLNIQTKSERIFERPVYDVSKDKKTALSLDFARLHALRPGYGYRNDSRSESPLPCPDDYCVWKIDLITGEIKGILKYTDLLNFEQRDEMIDATHKVNHLMINPSGLPPVFVPTCELVKTVLWHLDSFLGLAAS